MPSQPLGGHTLGSEIARFMDPRSRAAECGIEVALSDSGLLTDSDSHSDSGPDYDYGFSRSDTWCAPQTSVMPNAHTAH